MCSGFLPAFTLTQVCLRRVRRENLRTPEPSGAVWAAVSSSPRFTSYSPGAPAPTSQPSGAEAPPRAEHTALTERLLADADMDHEPLHGSPEEEEEGQEAVGAEALPAGHPPQEAPQAAAHQHGCGDMTGMGGGGRPWSPRPRPAANQRGRRLAPPPTRSPPSAGPASRRAVPRDAQGGALRAWGGAGRGGRGPAPSRGAAVIGCPGRAGTRGGAGRGGAGSGA